MPTVLLIRHGRSTANTSGVLAGRSPGIALDDKGRAQAQALDARLGELKLAAIVSSPLQRCLETIEPLAATRGLGVATEDRLAECDYGDWTGRTIASLMKERLWGVVQAHPSGVTFPGGESMSAMAARAAAAVRDWDRRVADEHGPGAVWAACSHGDLIKALVAETLGLHLDLFQRIVVDPGSVTAIRFTELRPFLVKLNDTGGDVEAYRPVKSRRRRSSEAVVGGGAGPAAKH
ncbi:MAG TPA: histidine phosphatase family protein [Sporichthyaceae bacterium]|jgi:probable phosphomutase (TIGR03848 family)|nr:histidine phosphatase family protein [Sporichthyaceae bacterium]